MIVTVHQGGTQYHRVPYAVSSECEGRNQAKAGLQMSSKGQELHGGKADHLGE